MSTGGKGLAGSEIQGEVRRAGLEGGFEDAVDCVTLVEIRPRCRRICALQAATPSRSSVLARKSCRDAHVRQQPARRTSAASRPECAQRGPTVALSAESARNAEHGRQSEAVCRELHRAARQRSERGGQGGFPQGLPIGVLVQAGGLATQRVPFRALRPGAASAGTCKIPCPLCSLALCAVCCWLRVACCGLCVSCYVSCLVRCVLYVVCSRFVCVCVACGARCVVCHVVCVCVFVCVSVCLLGCVLCGVVCVVWCVLCVLCCVLCVVCCVLCVACCVWALFVLGPVRCLLSVVSCVLCVVRCVARGACRVARGHGVWGVVGGVWRALQGAWRAAHGVRCVVCLASWVWYVVC